MHHPTAGLSPPFPRTLYPGHSHGLPCQLLLLGLLYPEFVPTALSEVVPEAFLCLGG